MLQKKKFKRRILLGSMLLIIFAISFLLGQVIISSWNFGPDYPEEDVVLSSPRSASISQDDVIIIDQEGSIPVSPETYQCGPFCGDGLRDCGPDGECDTDDDVETCDDGRHCEDGTQCLDNYDCEGIGDEQVCITRNDDGCSSTCTACGDGNLNPPEEECDDGNSQNGDGCNSNCQVELCPDGQPANPGPTCPTGCCLSGHPCNDECGGCCASGGPCCFGANFPGGPEDWQCRPAGSVCCPEVGAGNFCPATNPVCCQGQGPNGPMGSCGIPGSTCCQAYSDGEPYMYACPPSTACNSNGHDFWRACCPTQYDICGADCCNPSIDYGEEYCASGTLCCPLGFHYDTTDCDCGSWPNWGPSVHCDDIYNPTTCCSPD